MRKLSSPDPEFLAVSDTLQPVPDACDKLTHQFYFVIPPVPGHGVATNLLSGVAAQTINPLQAEARQ